MCGLFDTPDPPKPIQEKPAPFIFKNADKTKLKANRKGLSDLTVDLNTGGPAAAGLSIPQNPA